MTSNKGDGCSQNDIEYLISKLRSHRVLTEDLDAAADALAAAARKQKQLRDALTEAMDWNWLDDNAQNTIPSEVWKQCEGALTEAAVT